MRADKRVKTGIKGALKPPCPLAMPVAVNFSNQANRALHVINIHHIIPATCIKAVCRQLCLRSFSFIALFFLLPAKTPYPNELPIMLGNGLLHVSWLQVGHKGMWRLPAAAFMPVHMNNFTNTHFPLILPTQ